MIITNKHGLPEPLFRVLAQERYKKVGDFSATDLITPPQVTQLTRRHWDDLVEDATSRISRLGGEAMHYVLSLYDEPIQLKEKRLTIDVNGGVLSGQPDILELDGTLTDYKQTSVWSFIYGKIEYEQQLNIYAEMLRQHGYTVSRLQVIGFLYNWEKKRALAGHYGDLPFVDKWNVTVIHPDLWLPERAREFIKTKFSAHQAARGVSDEQLPPCTDEERWAKPATYAVKKPGAKKASRVLPSLAEAEEWIAQRGDTKSLIEERPATYQRCEQYCVVKDVCTQWKSEQATSD